MTDTVTIPHHAFRRLPEHGSCLWVVPMVQHRLGMAAGTGVETMSDQPTECTAEVVEAMEPNIPALDVWFCCYFEPDCGWCLLELDEKEARRDAAQRQQLGYHVRIVHVHEGKPDPNSKLLRLLEWSDSLLRRLSNPRSGMKAETLLSASIDKIRELMDEPEGKP